MNQNLRADDPLDDLRWRDEILEAMYWMQGEGIAVEVSAVDLVPLLATEINIIDEHLERLRELGSIEVIQATGEQKKYRLSAQGFEEARRRFYDEFKGHLSRDAHGGVCDDDCECHDDQSRATCEAERLQQD